MPTMEASENVRGCNTVEISLMRVRTKARPVDAIHYRNRFSLGMLAEATRGWAMASSRSKLRVAVRTLIKARERTRRRIRRRAHR
jgi:hypothetical protein